MSGDFESLNYIKRRILAGNDLSPRHGEILLRALEDLAEKTIKAHESFWFDQPEICGCHACVTAREVEKCVSG